MERYVDGDYLTYMSGDRKLFWVARPTCPWGSAHPAHGKYAAGEWLTSQTVHCLQATTEEEAMIEALALYKIGALHE